MKIGFVTLPVYGHLNPMIALARNLKARGHVVSFVGVADAAAAVNAAGLPFTDLGNGYIGTWYGDILDLMATISLFAISLGVASGAARIMYAQARDGTGKRTGLAGLTKHGQPGTALAVVEHRRPVVVRLPHVIRGIRRRDVFERWASLAPRTWLTSR